MRQKRQAGWVNSLALPTHCQRGRRWPDSTHQISRPQLSLSLLPATDPRDPGEMWHVIPSVKTQAYATLAVRTCHHIGTQSSRQNIGILAGRGKPCLLMRPCVQGGNLPSRRPPQALLSQMSPSTHSCSLPFLFIKKVIFFQISNLQIYEINIISNEPLGKCSPLNLAEDYGRKKKSKELGRALELPGV